MTTTAAKMIGHTLTVERIVDVPELIGTVLHRQATTNAYSGPVLAFIERRDGAFVACHGTNDQQRDLNPYNDHWTNCRLLAENLAGLAGPYEDLRYVSLTVGETLPAGVAPAKQAPMAPAETRTEYAIRLTAVRHGKWQTVIETVHPDHATDREWVEGRVADRRAWQDASARTPDAELISRTIVTSEWDSATKPARLGGICRWHYPLGEPGCRECATATPPAPPAFGKGDLVTFQGTPSVVTHVFWCRDCCEVIPGDDPDAVVRYSERRTVGVEELTARPAEQPATR